VVREPLQQHLYKVKALHERDLATGTGGVALPHAIERAYPNANRQIRQAAMTDGLPSSVDVIPRCRRSAFVTANERSTH